MSANSNIEWTDHTFNPWRGCAKVSPGCANCYAEARDKRFEGGVHWGNGKPRLFASADIWRQPVKWNSVASSFRECTRCHLRDHMAEGCPHCGCDTVMARQRVFCASLADWLDAEVPIEWTARLLKLIFKTQELDWLLLTKRPENWRKRVRLVLLIASAVGTTEEEYPVRFIQWLQRWLMSDEPPRNVWMGTTVEDQTRANERIPQLLAIPARVRFLSCEPLLGPLNIPTAIEASLGWNPDGSSKVWSLPGVPMINWVICGGESGSQARAMHPAWAKGLRDQCAAAGAPFLFKQWGEWLPNNQSPFERILFPNKLARRDWGAGAGLLSGDGSVSIRIGKGSAGRLLDGVEHNAFPA